MTDIIFTFGGKEMEIKEWKNLVLIAEGLKRLVIDKSEKDGKSSLIKAQLKDQNISRITNATKDELEKEIIPKLLELAREIFK